MRNREIAWHLQTISVLMELTEENTFKVRAFRNAARALKRLSRPVAEMLKDGSLSKLQGIGPGILKVVSELEATGESRLLNELKTDIPPGLVELGGIPGIGAKTARALVQNLGVQTVAELEAAIAAGKVRNLSGFGAKKKEAVLRGIELLRSQGSLVPMGIGRPLAEMLVKLLRRCDGVEDIQLAGGVRRWQELTAAVDLAASVRDIPTLLAFLENLPGLRLVEADLEKIILETSMDFPVRIWLAKPDNFAQTLLKRTGPPEHIKTLFPKGVPQGQSEEEVYAGLGLHWIPPEARQPGLDLEDFSLNNLPPPLVEAGDIRGDLHMHTRWSDGVLDIAAMAALAVKRGYEYIAVTDHSPSLVIAGGLSPERLKQQIREIRSMQESLPLEVLAGIETDIKSDGSLDLPNSTLQDLDWVVASVHSRFNLDKEAMTRRVITAMANPWVNAIGHPSGRILQRRPGYELDWPRIFAAARKHNVALEVNSSPDRLDIRDEVVRQACAQGVKIVINTDAHSGSELDYMRFGVATARRGGAVKSDVLNCLSLADLKRSLAKPVT